MKFRKVLIIFLSLVGLGFGLIGSCRCEEDEEEFCYWKPDGSQVCGEESEIHEIWAKDVDSEAPTDEEKDRSSSSITIGDEMLQFFKENDISLNKVELELILNYLDTEGDGSVGLSDLDDAQTQSPLQIVDRAISTFDKLDGNDDGKLNKDEFPLIGDSDSEKGITILEYCLILSRLDDSIRDTLAPFTGLDFLPPLEIKKVIQGSVKMFKDFDADESEGLNIDEYMASINRPDNKRAQQIGEDQKQAIFKMMDRDQNGEISYGEFQAIVPQKPKNPIEGLEDVFKQADLNGDGYWSDVEFTLHLRHMVDQGKGTPPRDEDILEAFQKLDEDGDGRVSETEMKGISREIEKIQQAKAVEGFNELDVDGDGILSRDEIVTMAEIMEERAGQKVDVEMLIKMLDKNGNQVIESEEVQALVKRMMTHV